MIIKEFEHAFIFQVTETVSRALRDWRFFLPDGATEMVAPRDYIIQKYVTLRAGNHVPTIGSFSVSHSALIDQETVIGRYCSIAANVTALGPEHPTSWATTSDITYQDSEAVMRARADAGVDVAPPCRHISLGRLPVIGNDVWIGQNVSLKRGITIGDGAIIGSGALVTKDVPPYAIVGGVPAKLIRYRFNERLIERFQRLRWWDYFEPDFKNFGYDDPDRFLDTFEDAVACGRIKPRRPGGPTLYDLIAI